MDSLKQLPGRMKAFYGMKGILARSLGYSRQFNERNLEFHWYPLWGHILHETFRDMETVIVTHQWPVWLDPREIRPDNEDDTPETSREGEDFEGKPGFMEVPSEHTQDLPSAVGEEYCDGETEFQESASFYSSGPTVAMRYVSSQVVDEAVLVLDAIPVTNWEFFWRYFGYRIRAIHVPVIIEIKRSCKRDLDAKEAEKMVRRIIATMSRQILRQAAYIFASHPHMDELIAIAAVGCYWSHAVIRRADRVSTAELNEIRKGTSKTGYKNVIDTVQADPWHNAAPLGSSESNKRFEEIRAYVQQFIVPVPAHQSLDDIVEQHLASALAGQGLDDPSLSHQGCDGPEEHVPPSTQDDLDDGDLELQKITKKPRRKRNSELRITPAVRHSVRLQTRAKKEPAATTVPAGTPETSDRRSKTGTTRGKKTSRPQ
ncbi:hypothetical protein OBBRIDRAFT_100909 [Obba rivulosa]|uniref:Uncharacterized protein n=1 Tax=Obba rivulosa TaxID=1052685 RepID=A0A8E2DS10_9APHY|nr:hypothetical protein OBBRIDRAFT_100909 [Obba rivulosa]